MHAWLLSALVVLMGLITPVETTAIEWACPVQAAAFAYGPFPQCYSGGWGAGKTWDACLKALWLSDTFPKNRGVIARVVGKELRATTMVTFFKLCQPSAYQHGRRNDQEGLLQLNNGSEILFLHLDDPNMEGIIKGLEINWFLIDQAEENPEQMEEIFDLMLGRLGRWELAEVPDWLLEQETAAGRPWGYYSKVTNRPVPPPYPIIVCNPDIETHWIYQRFHPESFDYQTTYKARGYRMFDFDSRDNRFLSDINKQYLLDHDDAFVRRNVKGLWGMPEGAIHAIDPRSLVEGSPEIEAWLQQTCSLHRTLDHGESSPTCCLWAAVTPDGDVVVYREYYLGNALISTHRANITALSEGERFDSNLADPSIFHKTSQKKGGRWSVADEYTSTDDEHSQTTALFWSPADNNELGTRNRINEYLRVDEERIHPFTHTKGAPRLFFLQANERYPQGCRHVIRETRSQRRVKIGTELGKAMFSDERDPNVTDHSVDCLRYMIASRPPLPRMIRPDSSVTTFAGQQRLTRQLAKQMAGRR